MGIFTKPRLGRVWEQMVLGSILYLFAVSFANAGELTKVSPALNYWYNYHCDPSYLQYVIDSLMSLPSDTLPNGDINGAPADDPLWLRLSVEPISLVYRDDVPYLSTFIQYDGDGGDLLGLGVEIHSPFISRGVAMVEFPLSMLPEVLALPSVKFIDGRGGEFENALDDLTPGPGSSRTHLTIHEPGRLKIVDNEGICDTGCHIYICEMSLSGGVWYTRPERRPSGNDHSVAAVELPSTVRYNVLIVGGAASQRTLRVRNLVVPVDSCAILDLSTCCADDQPAGSVTCVCNWNDIVEKGQ